MESDASNIILWLMLSIGIFTLGIVLGIVLGIFFMKTVNDEPYLDEDKRAANK